MCFGGGGDGGAAQARRMETERAARVKAGASQINAIFDQYKAKFFDRQRRAYEAFANPQLDDQYGNAQRDLTFALGRSGILESSAAIRKNAEAAREYGLQRQAIADKARSFADTAKSQMETTRGDVLQLNAALADPDQSTNIALARAKSLQDSPEFEPIGTVFQNVTAGIATLADAERRRSAYQNAFSGYATSGGGSGRNIS